MISNLSELTEENYEKCVSLRDESQYWDPEGLDIARIMFDDMNKAFIKEKLRLERIEL